MSDYRVICFHMNLAADAEAWLTSATRDGFHVETKPSGEYLWLVAKRPAARVPSAAVRSKIDEIVRVVSARLGVSKSAILAGLQSGSRTRREIKARRVAMYFARQTGESFPSLGKQFHCHHASVIEGCEWVKENLLSDPDFQLVERDLRGEEKAA